MGIFDVFSDSNANNAASAQTQGYQNGANSLAASLQAGTNYLQNQNSAANTAVSDATNKGASAASTNQKAADTGVNALLNALGLGSGGASDIAKTFENTPGYQYTLNEGTQNALRNSEATGGSVNNGATQVALQEVGQGTAQKYYQNYISNLLNFLGYSSSGANTLADLFKNLGNTQSSNDISTGQSVNSNENTQGAADYGANVGAGNAQATADYSKQQNSANIWNAIINALSAGAKAYGSYSGSSSGGSK